MACLVKRIAEDGEWEIHRCPLSHRWNFDEVEAINKAREFVVHRRCFEAKALRDNGETLSHWRWNSKGQQAICVEGKDPVGS